MMYRSGRMMIGWDYALMALGVLVVLALVVLIAVIGARGWFRAGRSNYPPATPDQTLASRFAHGDIDHDEYVRAQAALTAHRYRTDGVDPS